MTTASHLIITCEHGGNLVPPAWRGLFARADRLLMSHQGFDAGALTLAREMAEAAGGRLFFSKTTRLLVDLNRSIGHPQLFSAITRKLSTAGRQNLIALQYRPYRAAIENHIREQIAAGHRVIHIASHSFSPELKGRVREVDIGLLYDPARAGEVQFADALQAAILQAAPFLQVRRNTPYKGTSDGLTAALRKQFDGAVYLGLELEVNQKHVLVKNRHWPRLRHAVVHALRQALISIEPTHPGGE